MPYRKNQFVNGEVYHIILRAIDDNLIFKDIDDYYRGIFSIYEFNNAGPVNVTRRREQRKQEKLGLRPLPFDRNLIVEIFSFCFMPNHIHLLLRQIKDGGLLKFMVKLGSGYGRYFNQKYQRKGYVFQNRFKDIRIEDDNQLLTVFNYIHANPISLIEPNFKEQGIKNHSEKEIENFLEQYKWSSYIDYSGEINFPTVTQRQFMDEMTSGSRESRRILCDWIHSKKELAKHGNLFLE
jgi:putative transposase